MRYLVIFGLLALTACGADGEPEPPTMSGTVGVSTDGAFGGATIQRGRVSVSVGTGRVCHTCW